MNSEFPFTLYYLGLLIITVFLSRFIFRRYIGFAKRYHFTKSTNARAAHKGLVFTGGGVVYAAVIMVSAVVLDNLDFVETTSSSVDVNCENSLFPIWDKGFAELEFPI